MSDEATVLTDEADGVLVITINRPEAKNAVNLPVAQGVAAALERLDSDDSLRVGVLTGAGGTFCAGMDLKAFVSGEFPHIEGRGFGGMTERSADKPLIAAVEGYALAGGCELAIACTVAVGVGSVSVVARKNDVQAPYHLANERITDPINTVSYTHLTLPTIVPTILLV